MIEQRPAPTRYGLPIPLRELDIPTTYSDGHENNHHAAFTARAMGRFCILQTLRDLEYMQDVTDISRHNTFHSMFSAPNISIESAYDRIHEAFDDGEMRRIGSAACFELLPITPLIMNRCNQEYRELRHLL